MTAAAEPPDVAEAPDAAEVPAGTGGSAGGGAGGVAPAGTPAAPGGGPRNGTAPVGRRLLALEPWLLLAAGPPLVLWERFPDWARLAALLWIGLLWLLRRRIGGRWTVRTPLDGPVLALLAMLPVAIWAAGTSGPPGTAAALSRAASLVFAMALAYSLANAVTSPRRAWSAAMWLLVAGLGLVAVGMVSTGWLDKYPALTPLFPRLIDRVPHSVLETGVHPNQLAAALLPFALLALALLWPPAPGDEASETLRPPPALRGLAALSGLAALTLVVLTQSRGAWLALAVTVLVWLLVRWPRRRAQVAAGGLVVALVLGLLLVAGAGGSDNPLGAVLGRGGGAAGTDGAGTEAAAAFPGSGRLVVWRESLAMLAAAPATGIGLNTFVLVHGRRPEYQGGFVYQGLAHAHNTLLQAALDFGLPGLVAVVGLYVALAWSAWRSYRRLAGTPMAALVLGLALGLLAVALHGLVDSLAIGAKPGLVVWAFAGLLAGLRVNAHRWNPEPPRRDSSQINAQQ